MTQERWQRTTEWPLAGVAVVFLLAYSWEVIADLHGSPESMAEWIIWITWAIFVIDYVVNLALAPRRWRWFYTHLLDLAIVALPVLRPLRLLRLVNAFMILQRSAGTAFRGKAIAYVAGTAGLLVYVAALAELDAERGHGDIDTFGEGLWWAFVTITTVGYGDYSPVTATGRLIAVGVMLGGIALIGVVTATLASWIVEKVSSENTATQLATKQHIDELRAEIQAMRREFSDHQR